METTSAITSQNTSTTSIATDPTNQLDSAIQVKPESANTDSFSNFLKQALGGGSKPQISEEELFSAIVSERVQKQGALAIETFNAKKESLISSLRRPDGIFSQEELTLRALEETYRAGALEQGQAEKISGAAFQAAQLDDNLAALYDDRGSEADPTIAVSELEKAISSANTKITALEKDESLISPLSIESSPTGATSSSAPSSGSSSTGGDSTTRELDGSGGFLWKPVSDSNGKLVVLLPTDLKGTLTSVAIHSSLPPTSENLLDTGRFSGDTDNGNRPHYRFSKPGESYGDTAYVVATRDNGEQVSWKIDSPGERND